MKNELNKYTRTTDSIMIKRDDLGWKTPQSSPESLKHAVAAFGNVINYDEEISLTEFIKRISENYSSDKVDNLLCELKSLVSVKAVIYDGKNEQSKIKYEHQVVCKNLDETIEFATSILTNETNKNIYCDGIERLFQIESMEGGVIMKGIHQKEKQKNKKRLKV